MAYSRIEEQSSHIEELSYQIEELSSKLEPEVSACVCLRANEPCMLYIVCMSWCYHRHVCNHMHGMLNTTSTH